MKTEIDARGKACPEPVILAKKALETHDGVVITVNDEAAVQNVRRLAEGMGCSVTVERRGAEAALSISRQAGANRGAGESCTLEPASSGPVVVAVASDVMGRGDDELGRVLLRSFLHTLTEASKKPDVMIFFNTCVRLAVNGSDVLADLAALTGAGTKILVCGTCLGFFELKDQLGAGVISNMYDISEAMLGAGKLVQV